MSKKLQGRIALITGASRGIGAAVAKGFAAEGAHCILVARSAAQLQDVDDEIRKLNGGEGATLVPLDLLQYDAIDQLAGKIRERFGRLDILVGNAAMLGGLMPMTHFPPAVWHRVMELNVNANWHLIRAFDPLLRASENGRALFVTSGVTKATFPFYGPYATSKAALEMMVNIYAEETRNTNIKTTLIDPGVLRTQLRAEAYPGEDPMSLPAPETVVGKFLKAAQ